MSKKTFCDNCGSEMEPAIRGIRRRSRSGVYALELTGRDVNRGHSDPTDLCDACLLDLWEHGS